MEFFKTRYRIVRDNYLGYEAQYRRWWMLSWRQIPYRSGINTSSNIERARQIVAAHRSMNEVVETCK